MVVITKSAVKNRRQFIRIPSSCRVTIQKILFSAKADAEMLGQAQNISAGGLLVTSSRDYHHDELVKMSISLPTWKKHHPQFLRVDEDDITPAMTAICQIIRSKHIPDGSHEIAAKFVDVYEDDLVALKAYIEEEAVRMAAASQS